MENSSIVNDFILLGMTENAQIGVLLFEVFLVVYFVTVLGNLVLIRVSPCLHTPM